MIPADSPVKGEDEVKDASDSESGGDLPDIDENTCPACEQEYGSKDEDTRGLGQT